MRFTTRLYKLCFDHYRPHPLLYHVWSRQSNPIKSHVANTARILFGNRLDDLATALKTARLQTETSRRYNRERLAKKTNANDIAIGDSVVIRAEERTTFTSRWGPRWEVTRTRGPVIWVRQQQTCCKIPLAA